MSISSLAFNLCNAQSQFTIKRSHCYELIAAAYGFKSYAAFSAQHKDSPNLKLIDESQVKSRHSDLKLAIDSLESILDWLQKNLVSTGIVGIIQSLHEYAGDISTQDLETLKAKAETGDHWAHYGLGLIYGKIIDEAPSDYWYKQLKKGMVLSRQEQEFANAYLNYKNAKESCSYHLEVASGKGNLFALWKRFELFNDTAFFQSPVQPSRDFLDWEYLLVAEAIKWNASPSFQWKFQCDWLLAGASQGDNECIRAAANLLKAQHPLTSKCLVELARLLGEDIANSKVFAIHEDGSIYDDDIGGPVYANEMPGVGPMYLDESEVQTCRDRAGEWFREIEKKGRTTITLL